MEMEPCPQLLRKDDASSWKTNEKKHEVTDATKKKWDNSARNDQAACDDKLEKKSRTNNKDIGAIVSKSKKAASTLWTLLHAKNCRLGVNRCSQPGCSEAKLLYLHMKICAAGPGASCPTGHKGCNDSRKLLAHYRKCREIRARQAGQYPKAQQHACLVCTLVARQAKSMLDITTSSSQRKPNRKHTINPLSNNFEGRLSFHSNSSESSMVPSPPPNSPNGNRKVAAVSVSPEDIDQTFQVPQMMPPPTTRFAGVSSLGVRQRAQNTPTPSSFGGYNGASDNFAATRPRSDSVPAPELYTRNASPLIQEKRDQSPQRSNQQSQPNGRRRSVSCGGISALDGSPPLGCETIHEEEPGVSGGDRDFEDILNDF